MESESKENVRKPFVAVVIPCYRVTAHVLTVIDNIGPEVTAVFAIDDYCPEHSGDYIEKHVHDDRVTVICHKENLGVGGATMTGYRAAIAKGADVIVKIDGDGQMDPRLINSFIAPILAGEADYTKGNRFFELEKIRVMPEIRLLGNAVLSFMTKISSGYWDLFDPTNGYTAIHADVAKRLPLEKIDRRYFFETDMLFRLNTLKAVVIDVPIDACYGNEVSNLKIKAIVGEFLFKHVRNFIKRIFYNYYLREMSIASIELCLGVIMFLSGSIFGIFQWINSMIKGVTTPSGTVMLAALPILLGVQLILAFLSYDIANVQNRRPLHVLRRHMDFKIRMKGD